MRAVKCCMTRMEGQEVGVSRYEDGGVFLAIPFRGAPTTVSYDIKGVQNGGKYVKPSEGV